MNAIKPVIHTIVSCDFRDPLIQHKLVPYMRQGMTVRLNTSFPPWQIRVTDDLCEVGSKIGDSVRAMIAAGIVVKMVNLN